MTAYTFITSISVVMNAVSSDVTLHLVSGFLLYVCNMVVYSWWTVAYVEWYMPIFLSVFCFRFGISLFLIGRCCRRIIVKSPGNTCIFHRDMLSFELSSAPAMSSVETCALLYFRNVNSTLPVQIYFMVTWWLFLASDRFLLMTRKFSQHCQSDR